MQTEKPVIAAFDFDKTITYRDTTILFLYYSAGVLKTLFLLILAIPKVVAFLLGLSSRQETKEYIFTSFFKGKSLEEMKRLGESFSCELNPPMLRPNALKRLEWHRKQGHRCILVSASLDLYLEPWAIRHGFDNVVSSLMAVNSGKVTGKLIGLNCRGPEKVRRLRELLGDLSQYEIYAYGDSKGDKELLEAADHPYYRSFPDTR